MKRSEKRDKTSWKRKKAIKIALLSLAVILLFTGGFFAIYAYNMLNKVETVSLDKSNDALGINEEVQKKIQQHDTGGDVVNIALFGLDQRNLSDAGRSDSIIVLSIDKTNKKLKLSSLMRDSYVNIPGRGMDKITHAYAFGGAQLAIKTINENFGLNIKDYVTVNFFSLEKIIDALGGVTIDVKKDEVSIANGYIKEVAGLEHETPDLIKGPGKQVLSGRQAVAYSRNRYSGNGDYERTDRQRRVLSAMVDKIQAAGITKYPNIVNQLLPYVSTSVSKVDMLKLGTEVLTSGIKTVDQERFPIDGYSQGKMINSVWYLTFDIPATKDQVFNYIYEDVKPSQKK